MATSYPLQALLDHALHRLEAAERLLRMRKRREAAARQRLAELEGYRSEYHARLGGGSRNGMDIHMLRDFHGFLAKLDGAIQAQTGEVEKAVEAWRGAESLWTEARAKVKAYETLCQRHLAEVQRQEERREQRQSDELVNRRYASERQQSLSE